MENLDEGMELVFYNLYAKNYKEKNTFYNVCLRL